MCSATSLIAVGISAASDSDTDDSAVLARDLALMAVYMAPRYTACLMFNFLAEGRMFCTNSVISPDSQSFK